MLAGENHGGVEAYYGKMPGDVEDPLPDHGPGLGIEKIDLRRVVPSHAGSVVAVINIPNGSAPAVETFEDHRRVASGIVVVLDPEADRRVLGEVGAVEAVAGKGAAVAADEKLGSLPDPGGIEARMVGHHVGGQTNTPPEAALP